MTEIDIGGCAALVAATVITTILFIVLGFEWYMGIAVSLVSLSLSIAAIKRQARG